MTWSSGVVSLALDYSATGGSLETSAVARDLISGKSIGDVWIGGVKQVRRIITGSPRGSLSRPFRFGQFWFVGNSVANPKSGFDARRGQN